jgi:integrase
MSILSAPAARGQCQTVNEVIAMYLAQARRDLTPRSHETVSCILRRFGKSCGRLRLDECRPFDLQCWLNDHPEYRSEWYRRCVVSTIKRAFNWTCEMELIDRNPFAKMRCGRGHPQRRRPMTDEQFQTLLRGSDPTFRRFLIFLKFTGCRPGEAASMRWPDVHIEEACVVLKEHKTARKTGLPRVIPLVPTVIKLLTWMRLRGGAESGAGEQGHVFTNSRGNAFTRGWLSLKMQRLRSAFGAAPGSHALWAAASLWAHGNQERRESEASEPLYGTPPEPADRALHCRGGAYAAGAAGSVAGCLRSCLVEMTGSRFGSTCRSMRRSMCPPRPSQ